MQRVQNELHPDEPQNRSEAVVKVHQTLKQAVNQEVELAQSQKRESVRRENQVRLFGKAKNCRDRVKCEHDVRSAQSNDHQKHGSQVCAACVAV